MKNPHSHPWDLPFDRWWSILLTVLFIWLTAGTVPAAAETGAALFPGDLGGHITLRGTLSHPAGDSRQKTDDETLVDGSAELRLKYEAALPGNMTVTIHYENMLTGGESRRQQSKLLDRIFALEESSFMTGGTLEDDRRLFDLTTRLEEDDDLVWYHRLDRLYLSWNPGPMDIRVGRQAVTWGNGMIFNPMDLFNPFSPTDVERDYKIGDDMLSIETTGPFGHLHFLVVPRRDPADHHVSRDYSSVAVKYHAATGALEWDAMVGLHCRDFVAGAGVIGYLGGAAWRLDAVLTVPDNDDELWTDWKERDNYVSVVANIDLSWVWSDRNWYGLLEWYYNGLMSDDYARNMTVPYIIDRLDRGDLTALGRLYTAETLQWEVHPLVSVFLTSIANLEDPSGVILPRVTCDITEDIRITLGGTLNRGEDGTEYGGWAFPFPVPAAPAGTSLFIAPADTVYTWLTWYF